MSALDLAGDSVEAAWSVFGYWADSLERYGEVYYAPTPRAAEDLLQHDAAANGRRFHVAGVLSGQVPTVDRYTLFVDPRDPRNDQADALEMDSDELEVTTFSVLGLIRQPGGGAWNARTGGQRFLERVEALSPLAAEDVARSRARDQHGELLVCAVFHGPVQRADAAYAYFADPDLQPDDSSAPVR